MTEHEHKASAKTWTQVGLAAVFGIIVYSSLWYAGATLGFLFADVAIVLIVPLALAYGKKWIKRPALRQLAGDVAASLATGLALKLIVQSGMIAYQLPIYGAPGIAGMAIGIARRENFTRIFSNNLAKVAFSILVGVGIANGVAAFLALRTAMDIPDNAVTPKRVAEEWSVSSATSLELAALLQTGREYTKKSSFFNVWAERFPLAPRTQQEYKDEAESFVSGLGSIAFPAQEFRATLVEEEVNSEHGKPRYKFSYRIESPRESPVKAIVFYAWRCVSLGTDIKATALIKDEPVQTLLREVEGMVDSVSCL